MIECQSNVSGKLVNIISTQIFGSKGSLNMSSSKVNRTCCICKRLFCCADCCKRHQQKKHQGREFNCPLCCNEKLLLQHIADKEFFRHIVINHLPLYCCLCGDVFQEGKDLELFGVCRFWPTRRHRVSISDRKSLLETPSLGSAIYHGTKTKEHSTIHGDYNDNFGTLTSPPELYRTTSTPMHVAVVGQKMFEFKTPSVPNFSLKTPNTNSIQSSGESNATKNKTNSRDSNDRYISFSNCDSNQEAIQTPFHSFSLKRTKEEQSSRGSSIVSTRTSLPVMKEQDEIGYEEMEDGDVAVDMELTSGVGAVVLTHEQNLEKLHKRSELTKKVRFSDQFDKEQAANGGQLSSTRVSVGGTFNFTENEEYFEARDTLSETNKDLVPESYKTSPKNDVDDHAEYDDLNRVPTLDDEKDDGTRITTITTRGIRSTKETNDKEEEEISKDRETNYVVNDNITIRRSKNKIGDRILLKKENRNPEVVESTDCVADRSVPDSDKRQTESSRVVMMLVMENNGNRLSNKDITPLIESGIRTLSSVTARSNFDSKGCDRRSITSVNSYVSVSSVECVADDTSKSNDSKSSISRHLESDGSLDSIESNGSGGILSAMAYAVKNAFKHFSGMTATNVPQKDQWKSRKENTASMSSGSSLSSLTSCIMTRSRKRSRDLIEDLSSSSIDSTDGRSDFRSPLAKRYRGWYKIKGREPIARMKNDKSTVSPRGISSRIQVFSHGSLSVQDTIVPIPTRAHQSTQTD